jgi:hypothetical protein
MIMIAELALLIAAQCVQPEHFRQPGDGNDWQPAIARAIASHKMSWSPRWKPRAYGGCVALGARRYHVDHTIVIDRELNLGGVQGGGWFSATEIECAPSLNPCVKVSGAWSYIHDLAIKGEEKFGPPKDRVGVEIVWRAEMERVYVSGFSGDCVYIHATHTSSPTTDANGFLLRAMRIDKCGGDGLRVEGGDANAGLVESVDVGSVSGACFRDQSFLGNTYVAGQAAACGKGSYVSEGRNARNTYLGCYSESDSAAPVVPWPAVWLGGLTGQYPVGDGTQLWGNNLLVRNVYFGPYMQRELYSAEVPTSTVGFRQGDAVVASFPKVGGCERWRLIDGTWWCVTRIMPEKQPPRGPSPGAKP